VSAKCAIGNFVCYVLDSRKGQAAPGASVANHPEHRSGDQARINENMGKEEHSHTSQANLVESKRVTDVPLNIMFDVIHYLPPFGPRGATVSGRFWSVHFRA